MSIMSSLLGLQRTSSLPSMPGGKLRKLCLVALPEGSANLPGWLQARLQASIHFGFQEIKACQHKKNPEELVGSSLGLLDPTID